MENKHKYEAGSLKTLDSAIKNAICIGPLNEVKERSYIVIKDFMANKFQLAIFRMGQWRDGSSTRHSPEEILTELYESLTKRDQLSVGADIMTKNLQLQLYKIGCDLQPDSALIAAAPEMYDLLFDLSVITPTALHNGHNDLIERTKELLKKVRGET